jgi:hypothetical protein
MPRKLKVLPPKDDEGVPPGVPPPNDGPEVEVTGHNAVNINRRSKLTVKGVPPGGPPGVPPPNDGPEVEVTGHTAVNINRRSKLTVKGVPSGVPPPNDGSASGSGASSCTSSGATTGTSVNFAETNEALPQPNYLESLSQLELRVCSIARDHLESSFDLSRSTGYLAWKAKNGM